MEDEIAEFLRIKFLRSLAEFAQTRIPFKSRFQDLEEVAKKLPEIPQLSTERQKLRNILYDLNEVLRECLTLSKKRDRLCGEGLWFRPKAKKRLADIKARLQQLIAFATQIQINPDPPPSSSPHYDRARWSKDVAIKRWSSRSVDTSKVHGFDDKMKEMEEFLFEGGSDGGFKAVGIVGMGGIGKTALAQLIFNTQEVKNHFCPRIWICVSQRVHKENGMEIEIRKEIVTRILMHLGIDSPDNNLAELLFILHLQLMGKRYLIVFDDVWDTDEWYDQLQLDLGLPEGDQWSNNIRNGLPKDSGGRVVVTGRLEDAVKKMVGENNLLRLSPWNGETCWPIFVDTSEIHRSNCDHPSVDAIKTEILEKCDGLPLAAKTMGQIMRATVSVSTSETLL
ncbi:PREDICTED: probable disease resistance protein At5g45440 [Nelumbo nucifera]|uniref:NB-ARC domain-containing protein n=2 Tax=Nelumbo nucifera TaxID=4432 RepID=A0A822ZJG6_NELNU|nr:PREDICTED: probable disease resistance protein At5g45440 [Nelumbo nucifera]DAD43529.1 TPA_asm: hypothetical protein HUJ06_001759 [Nelumbo nucifera]